MLALFLFVEAERSYYHFSYQVAFSFIFNLNSRFFFPCFVFIFFKIQCWISHVMLKELKDKTKMTAFVLITLAKIFIEQGLDMMGRAVDSILIHRQICN